MQLHVHQVALEDPRVQAFQLVAHVPGRATMEGSKPWSVGAGLGIRAEVLWVFA